MGCPTLRRTTPRFLSTIGARVFTVTTSGAGGHHLERRAPQQHLHGSQAPAAQRAFASNTFWMQSTANLLVCGDMHRSQHQQRGAGLCLRWSGAPLARLCERPQRPTPARTRLPPAQLVAQGSTRHHRRLPQNRNAEDATTRGSDVTMEILNCGIRRAEPRGRRLRRSDAERDHPNPAAARQRRHVPLRRPRQQRGQTNCVRLLAADDFRYARGHCCVTTAAAPSPGQAQQDVSSAA